MWWTGTCLFPALFFFLNNFINLTICTCNMLSIGKKKHRALWVGTRPLETYLWNFTWCFSLGHSLLTVSVSKLKMDSWYQWIDIISLEEILGRLLYWSDIDQGQTHPGAWGSQQVRGPTCSTASIHMYEQHTCVSVPYKWKLIGMRTRFLSVMNLSCCLCTTVTAAISILTRYNTTTLWETYGGH